MGFQALPASIHKLKLFKNGQNFDAYFVNQEFIQSKSEQIFEAFYIHFERTRTKFRLQASSFDIKKRPH